MTFAVLVMANILLADPTGIQSVPKGFVELLEVREFPYGDHRILKYQLFTPRCMKPKEHYPMLVWLYHDEDFHFDHIQCAIVDPKRVEEYRFFLLAISCPSFEPDWFQSVRAADFDTAEAILQSGVIQKTIRDCPVDPDRVYLTGVSAGGARVWNMAVRYPEMFAAVVPMASGGCDPSQVKNLVHVPMWVFHSRFDENTPCEGETRTVAAIKDAGGNAHITYPKTQSHDCWTPAFRDHGVMAWMLEQRRGSLCWRPPGHRPWQWRHMLPVPGVFLALVAVGWWAERHRRRTKRRATNTTKAIQ